MLFASKNDEISMKIHWNTDTLMGWQISFYLIFMESSFSPIFGLHDVLYVIDGFARKF